MTFEDIIKKNAFVLVGEDGDRNDKRVKSLLKKEKIAFHYIDRKKLSAKDRKAMTQCAGASKAIPQGFVFGIHIGTWNGGSKYWHGIENIATSGRLAKALADKGNALEILESIPASNRTSYFE